MDAAIALIEAHRAQMHQQLDASCNDMIDRLKSINPPKSGALYKMPTLADGLDPRNKNGVNLTERGAEIIYRLFDDGAG